MLPPSPHTLFYSRFISFSLLVIYLIVGAQMPWFFRHMIGQPLPQFICFFQSFTMSYGWWMVGEIYCYGFFPFFSSYEWVFKTLKNFFVIYIEYFFIFNTIPFLITAHHTFGHPSNPQVFICLCPKKSCRNTGWILEFVS